jgi:hypothetical protein
VCTDKSKSRYTFHMRLVNRKAGLAITSRGAATSAESSTEALSCDGPSPVTHIKYLEKRLGHTICFQEDNGPSHGTRSTNNVCARLKRTSYLTLLVHPAQSPDLNPKEGIFYRSRTQAGVRRTVYACTLVPDHLTLRLCSNSSE